MESDSLCLCRRACGVWQQLPTTKLLQTWWQACRCHLLQLPQVAAQKPYGSVESHGTGSPGYIHACWHCPYAFCCAQLTVESGDTSRQLLLDDGGDGGEVAVVAAVDVVILVLEDVEVAADVDPPDPNWASVRYTPAPAADSTFVATTCNQWPKMVSVVGKHKIQPASITAEGDAAAKAAAKTAQQSAALPTPPEKSSTMQAHSTLF